jgi:hypothetical protein
MTSPSARSPQDHNDAPTTDDRDETPTERLDRNWTEILQELRVIQTGTQILTGFLLTLAFQPRFLELDAYQTDVYLVLVILAVLSTGLGLTPVGLHRMLFRKRAKEQLVDVADTMLQLTMGGVALLLSGTAMLIFDVVLGRTAGIVVGASALLVTVGLWVVLPYFLRPRRTSDRHPG